MDDSASHPFDGSPGWKVRRVLPDGTVVWLRPVGPDDKEELRREFLALSEQSRYYRFLQFGTEPTEDLLTYLTTVDQKDHVAIGATIESPDLKTERGIGIARFVRLQDAPDTAEAAVTVVDDMHRRGVGGVLLRELLEAARARGIRTLRGEVLADNERMRTILERAQASPVPSESGEGTIAYDIPIREEPQARASVFEVLRGAAETMSLRLRKRG